MMLKVLTIVALMGAAVANLPECSKIECPDFTTMEKGDGYEIRKYNRLLWAKYVVEGDSYKSATSEAFGSLFNYINGANVNKTKIDMTAPVVTRILPSSGPVCASTFQVHFYVPSMYQKSGPPKPTGNVTIVRQEDTCVAVKEFAGFTSDSNVVEMAASLQTAIAGSKYNYTGPVYDVAEYDSPFQLFNRHNEIWLPLQSCSPRTAPRA